MPIILLDYKIKINKSGTEVKISLVECNQCHNQRDLTKSSIQKNVGLDLCRKCYLKNLSIMNKERIWTLESKEMLRNYNLKEKSKKWNKNREEIIEKKKLRNLCYSLLRSCLKSPNHTKTINNIIKKLGYKPIDMINRVISTWEEWMNWNNYGHHNKGNYKMWNIDHIISIDDHFYKGIKDIKIINKLDNIRAIESNENYKKQTK